ncbi:MAG: MFS transporter [Mangrovibacterium sp.]
MKDNQKLSVVEKIGYSLGDLAANLIFQTLMTFLAFFYTDVFKIPSGAASSIIFVGGMIGACFNPIMGVIADRTNTRWGKYRPWLLWTAIPFGVMAILAFSTPNFSLNGKIAYGFITYILLVMIYSANNLPYSALSGVITGNMAERNSLSSYRFVAVTIAQFIIQALLLPMVLVLGDGDKAVGFEKTMMIFSITGAIFFIIAFLTTKERIVPKPEQQSSVKDDLRDLSKNKPWIAMLVLTVFVFITLSIKGGTYVYYFENYLDRTALQDFMHAIGFNSFIASTGLAWPDDVATSAFSLFSTGGIIFTMVGIGLSKGLADKYGKRNVFGVALFIATMFLLVFAFFSPESIALVFVAQMCHGLFYGITTPLLWAMIADVADYSEWKNNRRATAIIFSAMVFGLKAGLSIGGAMVAGILGAFGYNEALAVQSPETVHGIKMLVSVIPTATFLIAIACLFFYEIDKKMEVEIENDLKERH